MLVSEGYKKKNRHLWRFFRIFGRLFYSRAYRFSTAIGLE
jgi:hypothetical protein